MLKSMMLAMVVAASLVFVSSADAGWRSRGCGGHAGCHSGATYYGNACYQGCGTTHHVRARRCHRPSRTVYRGGCSGHAYRGSSCYGGSSHGVGCSSGVCW
ncbi:hypothetical protein [Blastopirellula marina]|uniref:hypothetical protein n=1 Tax=Blastopirellula marina TaxID=124 RepID=UPI0011B0A5C4|nr:hypothetical protein [Blastopirellula marina]